MTGNRLKALSQMEFLEATVEVAGKNRGEFGPQLWRYGSGSATLIGRWWVSSTHFP
jgi:hypothetical protein